MSTEISKPGISVRVVPSVGQMKTIENFQGSTWGELKQVLVQNGYNVAKLKCVEGVTKNTLELDAATLPNTNFNLFVLPVESKAGAKAAKKASEPVAKASKAGKKAASKTSTPKASAKKAATKKAATTTKKSATAKKAATTDAKPKRTKAKKSDDVTPIAELVEQVAVEEQLPPVPEAVVEAEAPVTIDAQQVDQTQTDEAFVRAELAEIQSALPGVDRGYGSRSGRRGY